MNHKVVYCPWPERNVSIRSCRINQSRQVCWNRCLECENRTVDEYGTKLKKENDKNGKASIENIG